jgi:hypothetical protein
MLGEPGFTDDITVEPPQPAAQYDGPEEGNHIRDYITRHYF